MSEQVGEEALAENHEEENTHAENTDEQGQALTDNGIDGERMDARRVAHRKELDVEEEEDSSLSLWDRFKARAEKEVEQQRLEEVRQTQLREEIRVKAAKEEAEEENRFQAELDRREAERKRVITERKRKKEEDMAAPQANKAPGVETSAGRAAEWSMNLETTLGGTTETTEELPSNAAAAKKRKLDVVGAVAQSSIVLQFSAACSAKIVGRAGGTITKVRQTCCADVKMKKQAEYCEVSISGKSSSVEKAKQMVIDHAGEQPRMITDTTSTSTGPQTGAPQPNVLSADNKDAHLANAAASPEKAGNTVARTANEEVEMKEAVADTVIDKPTLASANGQIETALASLGKVDVVVKIGGSACTKKAQFETLNEVALNASATQLSDLAKETGCSMAIIHGAGSFGHQQAKEFGVSMGQPDGTKELSVRLREGFAKTRLSVMTLNKHVVTALVEEGLPAVGISPCPFVATVGKKLPSGRLPSSATAGVRSLLEAQLVPVVHGDAVMDETQACAILSGDVWMVELCREFSARSAVFITDVDGVLTKPPSEPDGELIRDIWVNMQSGELELGNASVSQASHDVTGGLTAKLKCIAQILVQAPDVQAVYIVRAGTESVAQALRGETPKNGTTIRRRAC